MFLLLVCNLSGCSVSSLARRFVSDVNFLGVMCLFGNHGFFTLANVLQRLNYFQWCKFMGIFSCFLWVPFLDALTQFHLSVYQVSVVTSVWAVIRNRSRTQQLSWPLLGFIAMILKSSKTWFWSINTVLKLFGKNQITSQKTINSLLNLQSFWNNWDWWFFDSGFFFFFKEIKPTVLWF